MIYLAKGTLPWYDIVAKTPEKLNEGIAKKKCEIQWDQLCKDMPQEMYEYFKYVGGLSFTKQPNY